MKIGVVVDNEFDNDVRVQKEVSILQQQHEVFVLCFSFEAKKKSKKNITRIPIPRKLKDLLFGTMNRLFIYEYLWYLWTLKFIKNNEIEVVHTHDLYMSKAIAKACRKHKIKYILDLHENFPTAIMGYNWTRSPVKKWLSQPHRWKIKEEKYLKLADQIIVLSDFFKSQLLEKYPSLDIEKIHVFENVIDFDFFDSQTLTETKLEEQRPILFYFGGVAERRGIFDTFEVFRKFKKEGHNGSLLIIGPIDGPDKVRFFSLMEDSSIKDHVKYEPWIDLKELRAYLESVDICLAPFLKNEQHDSGVANKIYQYMYGAKPIIASDCYSQERLIYDAECGLIFKNRSEFLQKLTVLSKDEQLRIEMGRNGKEYLDKHYRSADHNQRLFDVYERL